MLCCFGWPAAWEVRWSGESKPTCCCELSLACVSNLFCPLVQALTLKSAAITPVYAIVTFCVVLQPNLGEIWSCSCSLAVLAPLPLSHPHTHALDVHPPLPAAGTASQFVLMRAAGAVVGGTLGLLCAYITLAANGGSYGASPTKAAVMVLLLSLLAFALSLYRFRYPRFWFAYAVATFRCGRGRREESAAQELGLALGAGRPRPSLLPRAPVHLPTSPLSFRAAACPWWL